MRINFRFIGMFLTVCIVLLGAVFVVHYFQTRRSASEILAAAREARDQDKIAEAVPLYAKYIGLEPDSATPREEVGKLLADAGQYDRAFFHLETAVRMDPSLTDARKRLVDVAIVMQRFLDAKSHLTDVLIPAEPENAELVWQLAKCFSGDLDFDSAQQQLEKAHQMQPSDSRISADLANLLTDQRSQPDQARKLLNETIAADETKPLSYVARGKWLLGQAAKPRQTDSASLAADAWHDAQKCVELDPTNLDVVLFVVDAALAVDKLDEAITIVERSIEANPKAAMLYLRAAEVEQQRGNAARAIEHMQAGLQAVPGHGELMWNLAQLELDSGDLVTVEKLLSDLRNMKFAEGPMRYLQAATAAKRGQWQAAVELLENSKSLLQTIPQLNTRADLLLATCYQELGDREAQMAALNRSIGGNPGWSAARETLAQTLLQAGRVSDALAEFRPVMGEAKAPVSALLGLANALFLSQSGRERPDWSELQRVIERLETVPSAANEVSVLKAAMLVGSGDDQAAEQLLANELENQPSKDRLWLAMISLHAQDQQWEKVEQDIEQAKKSVEDSLALRLVQATYLTQRYGKEVDVGLLEQLAEPLPQWSDKEKSLLATSFARAFWSIDDFDRCRKYGTIAAATSAGSANLSLQMLMFDVAIQQQDEQLLSQTLERVDAIEGHGPLWKVGEASRLRLLAAKLDPSDTEGRNQLLQQAITQLQEAAEARPSWARVPAIVGNLYDQREQPENAVEQYLKAIKLGEKDPNLVARTIDLLYKQRRFVEANDIIRQLQEQKSVFSTELSRLASQVSLELADFDQALNLAKQWAADSNQASDHNWLGQVYSISGRTAEAEQEFRKAIELEPAAAASWVSLVQMHARAKDIETAKKVIEEAKQAISAEERDDAIAQCYQSIGEFDLAEKSFRDALAKRPQDAGLNRRFAEFYLKTRQDEQALPLLEQLLSQTTSELSAADLAWTRRSLALILGTKGDAAASVRALELLDVNLASPVANDDDKRTQAILLATRADAASTDRAIKILEGLTAGAAQFSIADNFLLAQIYARKQAWTPYRNLMRSVLGNGGANQSVYVADYVKSLLIQRNLSEAGPWLGRLKKLIPKGDLAIDTLESEYYFIAKDYKRLLQLLQNRVSLPASALWAADMSEKFAATLQRQQPSEETMGSLLKIAEDGYRKVAESEPKQAYLLARLYARLSRHGEAARLIQDQAYEPPQLMEIIQAALQSDNFGDQASKAYLDLVDQAAKSHPDHPELSLSLGDLHSWRGDWQQSATAYERMLQSNPNHIPGLNNLAMILALTSQRLPDARQAIERAIAAIGPKDFLLDTRGIVLLAAGDSAGAEQDFRQAIASAPLPDRFFHLAQALLSQKKMEDARKAFAQAQAGGIARETVHSQERATYDTLASQLGN